MPMIHSLFKIRKIAKIVLSFQFRLLILPLLSVLFFLDTIGMRSKVAIKCPICNKNDFSKNPIVTRKVVMPEFFKTRSKIGKYFYLFLFFPIEKLRGFLTGQIYLYGLKSRYTFLRCVNCNSFVRDFYFQQGALLPDTTVYEDFYYKKNIRQKTFGRRLEHDSRLLRISDFIASKVSRGTTLGLDVGCAEGYLSVIMKRDHGISLHGTDPSESMILFAKQNHGMSSCFTQGSYNKDMFAEGTFDFIVCTHVIEHLLDPTLAIETFYYHLKKSENRAGLLFLSTPCANLLSSSNIKREDDLNFGPSHLWLASLEGLTKKVIDKGFELIYTELNSTNFLSSSGEKPNGMTLVFATKPLIKY